MYARRALRGSLPFFTRAKFDTEAQDPTDDGDHGLTASRPRGHSPGRVRMADRDPGESALVPRVREGIDVTRAGLSLEEGYLVSRVDGRTSVRELALLIGKPLHETSRIADRLVAAGVLELGAVRGPTRDLEKDPYAGFVFDPDAMSEPVDLSPEERKRILYTHARLSVWNHYELLGVRWRDDNEKVKRAFRKKSMEWHPDRFRRPNLGSFARRIDEIFRTIQQARQVLTDPQSKAEYDRIHAPTFDEEDMAEVLAARRREERQALREEERRRRRLERNPMRKRMIRAQELYEEALELEAKGELLEAHRVVQTACAFHEKSEYRELRKRLQAATAELRIAPLMRRGLHLESMTSWEDAVTVFTEAVRIAPEHGPARLRLAFNMVKARRPLAQISEHITQALKALPEEPEAHYVRGLCYELGEMEKAAVRAYQRAVELKPNYAEAKKRLKKLRWGF